MERGPNRPDSSNKENNLLNHDVLEAIEESGDVLRFKSAIWKYLKKTWKFSRELISDENSYGLAHFVWNKFKTKDGFSDDDGDLNLTKSEVNKIISKVVYKFCENRDKMTEEQFNNFLELMVGTTQDEEYTGKENDQWETPIYEEKYETEDTLFDNGLHWNSPNIYEKTLSKEVAEARIKFGGGEMVISRLDLFDGLDLNVAIELAKLGLFHGEGLSYDELQSYFSIGFNDVCFLRNISSEIAQRNEGDEERDDIAHLIDDHIFDEDY